MTGMEIWINPACSKCRSALTLLDAEGADYTVRRYLDDVPSQDEIRAVLERLGLEPWDIARTQEPVAKELGLREWPRAASARTLDRGARRAPQADPAADHHRGRRFGRGGAYGRGGAGGRRPLPGLSPPAGSRCRWGHRPRLVARSAGGGGAVRCRVVRGAGAYGAG